MNGFREVVFFFNANQKYLKNYKDILKWNSWNAYGQVI